MIVDSHSEACGVEEDEDELQVQDKAHALGIKILPLKQAQIELEDKLLKGWCMLNRSCPISRFPLVQNKQTGEIWSIRCQMRVSTETADQKVAMVTKDQSTSNYTKDTQMQSQSDLDQQSSLIADKLLRGWRMLDENCPITGACPLMLDPANNRKWSAAVNNYVDNRESDSLKKKLYVLSCRNLPSSTRYIELQEHFAKYGKVKRLDMNAEDRSAVIVFEDFEAAQKAYEFGSKLQGNNIKIEFKKQDREGDIIYNKQKDIALAKNNEELNRNSLKGYNNDCEEKHDIHTSYSPEDLEKKSLFSTYDQPIEQEKRKKELKSEVQAKEANEGWKESIPKARASIQGRNKNIKTEIIEILFQKLSKIKNVLAEAEINENTHQSDLIKFKTMVELTSTISDTICKLQSL